MQMETRRGLALEFLIISSPELDSVQKPLEVSLAAIPLLHPGASPLQYYDFGSLFVAANDLTANDICAVGFDGYAIDGKTAYSSGMQAPPGVDLASRYLDGCLDAANTCDLMGLFSLIRVNPHTKAFNVAADPLSLYQVFICGFGDTLMVSNNSLLIAAAVASFGLTLTRSSKALAQQIAAGGAMADRTGFREVSLLPRGKMVAGIGPNWRLIDTAPHGLPAPDGYEPWLEQTAQRLKNTVNAAYTASGANLPAILNITGNAASSVVLAAATASDIKAVSLAPNTPKHTEQAAKHILGNRYQPNTAASAPANQIDDAAFKAAADRAEGAASHIWPLMAAGAPGEECVLDASADPALFDPLARPKWGAMFMRTPFSSIAKFSNGDPVLSVCAGNLAAGMLTSKKAVAARWTYSLMQQNQAMHPYFTRGFLRQATQALHKEVSDNLMVSGQLSNRFYNQNRMRRQVGGRPRVRVAGHEVYSPLLDPMVSLRTLQRIAPQHSSEQVIKDLCTQLVGGSAASQLLTAFRKNKAPGPSYRQSLKAVQPGFAALVHGLPASAEPWTYLNRKKVLAELASHNGFSGSEAEAKGALGLYQMLLWAAADHRNPMGHTAT